MTIALIEDSKEVEFGHGRVGRGPMGSYTAFPKSVKVDFIDLPNKKDADSLPYTKRRQK